MKYVGVKRVDVKRVDVKRVVDAAVSLVALAVLAPVLALIAVAVWMADFESPIFAGPRIGYRGREFRMLKFRSMSVHAWKSGVYSTAAGDRRITRVGRFLRRFKLDELPQLVNILKGDMSLVGPRPQVPEEVALYTAEERRLLEARPGITDLASIVFADEGDILKDSRDPDLEYERIIRPWKSRLGLLYVDHRSPSLDGRIVLWTALAMFRRRGALDRVAKAVRQLGADDATCRMAARREPLIAYPPPGVEHMAEALRLRTAGAA